MLAGMALTIAAQSGAIAGDLYDAAMAGNLDEVQKLAAAGADINDRGDSGTALHLAATQENIPLATFLIDKGADLEARTTATGTTPLHTAVTAKSPVVVALLLERGAKVDARDFQERTPLHLASRMGQTSIAKQLLDKGADANVIGYAKSTPLFWAVAFHKEDVIRLLLERGAEVNVFANGETPLHIAAQEGLVDAIELFAARGANLNAKSAVGQSPLAVAKSNGQAAAATALRRLGAVE